LSLSLLPLRVVETREGEFWISSVAASSNTCPLNQLDLVMRECGRAFGGGFLETLGAMTCRHSWSTRRGFVSLILSAEYCGTRVELRPRLQLRGRSVALDLALVVVIALVWDGRLEWCLTSMSQLSFNAGR